jgi:error-prone DNA polymerase
MTDWEEVAAEYSVQGLSARMHPMQLIRDSISPEGVLISSEVMKLSSGSRVRCGGYVICRQAPRTAKGHVFLTIEDEDGLLNVILKPEVYHQHRYLVRTESLLLIDGTLQRRDGISNILAEQLASLRQRQDTREDLPTSAARNFC